MSNNVRETLQDLRVSARRKLFLTSCVLPEGRCLAGLPLLSPPPLCLARAFHAAGVQDIFNEEINKFL